jgi:hypothetical protein
MDWLKARILEISTWRGIGGMVTALGLATAGQVDAVIAIGVAIISAVEVLRKDAK